MDVWNHSYHENHSFGHCEMDVWNHSYHENHSYRGNHIHHCKAEDDGHNHSHHAENHTHHCGEDHSHHQKAYHRNCQDVRSHIHYPLQYALDYYEHEGLLQPVQ